VSAGVFARAGVGRRWLWVAAALLVVVAAGVGGWPWWTHRGFVEYRMLRETDIPTAVAVAADGIVWFTIELADAIGRLRDGRIERLPKGKQNVEPMGLAVDAEGNAWFTDSPARAISRISPAGVVTMYPLETPIARLARLALAPDGAVWFADGTTFSITRLKKGVFTRHELSSFRAGPFGVAVDRQGTAWATLQNVNRLARIPPGGELAEIDVPTRASNPTDVAVDASGAVWFLEFRANKVGRYAEGRFTEFKVPTPHAGLTAIATAPDGAVWFTELRAHRLARLRDGVVTEFRLPRGDARPFGIAVDRANNVWYTDLAGYLGMLSAARATAR
jgi:virginiamycin B lyase